MVEEPDSPESPVSLDPSSPLPRRRDDPQDQPQRSESYKNAGAFRQEGDHEEHRGHHEEQTAGEEETGHGGRGQRSEISGQRSDSEDSLFVANAKRFLFYLPEDEYRVVQLCVGVRSMCLEWL